MQRASKESIYLKKSNYSKSLIWFFVHHALDHLSRTTCSRQRLLLRLCGCDARYVRQIKSLTSLTQSPLLLPPKRRKKKIKKPETHAEIKFSHLQSRTEISSISYLASLALRLAPINAQARSASLIHAYVSLARLYARDGEKVRVPLFFWEPARSPKLKSHYVKDLLLPRIDANSTLASSSSEVLYVGSCGCEHWEYICHGREGNF